LGRLKIMNYIIRDHEEKKELEVTANAIGNFLEIGVKGYGDCESEDGHGCPIVLDYFGGKLHLLVYADINSSEPTHKIDLAGALESNRIVNP